MQKKVTKLKEKKANNLPPELNKTVIQKDLCTALFIVVCNTIVKRWNQSRCLTKNGLRRCGIATQWNTTQL